MNVLRLLPAPAFEWITRRIKRSPDCLTIQKDTNHALLYEECALLAGRLLEAERNLTDTRLRLYDLQQHYAAEHFSLYERTRNLTIERLRNAGAYSQVRATLERSALLQQRIADLKTRLRKHEPVDDWEFDERPILIESVSNIGT